MPGGKADRPGGITLASGDRGEAPAKNLRHVSAAEEGENEGSYDVAVFEADRIGDDVKPDEKLHEQGRAADQLDIDPCHRLDERPP